MINFKTDPDHLVAIASNSRLNDQPNLAHDLEAAAHDIKNLRDELARANRFQELAAELFADPIKAIVKAEMAAYAEDFDISAYEEEIKEIAADGFDIADYNDDIQDAMSFDIIDHASDIETIVRDVLRDATIKLEV